MQTPLILLKNPIFTSMNFSGKYICTLQYGEGYSLQHKNGELTFQMEIEEADNLFSGSALDIKGIGISPYKARVTGLINGIHIEFDKIYEKRHADDGNGNTVFENKEGFPILYEGTYNDDTGYYEGKWKYNVVRRFLFFFSWPINVGSGTFRLKKRED